MELNINKGLMSHKKPYLIQFNSIGEVNIGYISVAQEMDDVPFEMKRVYWTYFTPQNVKRGGHANINKELVLIAVAGTIIVETETIAGDINNFTLDKPTIGLYIPALCWHTMQYSHNAVQLVLASNKYDKTDYIRDYQTFKKNH